MDQSRPHNTPHARDSRGQSLIETALVLPVLLLLVLNAINFGYFYLVALNLAAAPRTGVAYSTLGFASLTAGTLPPAGPPGTSSSVSYLTYQDLTGAIYLPSSAAIQVCSKVIGISGTGASRTARCVTCSGSSCGAAGAGSPAPGADPESPSFIMNRVDVTYTFAPLIPGTPFGLSLLPISACAASGGTVTCTFTRHVSMRAMD